MNEQELKGTVNRLYIGYPETPMYVTLFDHLWPTIKAYASSEVANAVAVEEKKAWELMDRWANLHSQAIQAYSEEREKRWKLEDIKIAKDAEIAKLKADLQADRERANFAERNFNKECELHINAVERSEKLVKALETVAAVVRTGRGSALAGLEAIGSIASEALEAYKTTETP